MKICNKTKTVIILGSSAGLNELDQDAFDKLKLKQKEGAKVLCYSSAMSYAMNNDFIPDYFMFIDPQTIKGGRVVRGYPTTKTIITEKGLNLFDRRAEINSTLLCWDCVASGSKTFKAQGLTSKTVDWSITRTFINDLEKRKLVEILPIKNIFYCDFFEQKASLDIWLNSYEKHNSVVVGYPSGMGRSKSGKSTKSDDKLTSSILPIVLQKFPSVTRIVLLGFGDPKSFRWFSTSPGKPNVAAYTGTVLAQQSAAMALFKEYFDANNIVCATLSKNPDNNLHDFCETIELDDI